MNSKQVNELHSRVTEHLNQIYPEIKTEELALRLIQKMGLDEVTVNLKDIKITGTKKISLLSLMPILFYVITKNLYIP